jgi:cyclopropane fatty-acyl-phospholipid synthase-like methyltransferase
MPEGPWFNEIARFLGPAYWAPESTRVQAFTTGTANEIDFLVAELGLEPGMRVLDAGCGPGRHSLALAERGINVVGVDLAPEFIELARASAGDLRVEFRVGDVREINERDTYDAIICLCQGGFGLLGGGDREHDVITRFGRALRPGGRLAVSAFSSYFAVRHLESGDTFDAATGVNHESATIRDAAGTERTFDLWTTCYTPRELELLATRAGLRVDDVYGVAPGRYARTPPSIDVPEHLLVATRPTTQ